VAGQALRPGGTRQRGELWNELIIWNIKAGWTLCFYILIACRTLDISDRLLWKSIL
jgi:hypothetical protein